MTPLDWADAALGRLRVGAPVAIVTVLATEGSAPRDAGARVVVWSNGQWGTIGGGALEHQAARQARRLLESPGGPPFAIQDYPLGPLLAQCCGGRVRLLIERLDAMDAAWLAEASRRIAAGVAFTIEGALGSPGRGFAPPRGPSEADGLPIGARGSKPAAGARMRLPGGDVRQRLLLFGAGHVGRACAPVFSTLPFRLEWYDPRPEIASAAGAVTLAGPALLRVAAEGAPYTVLLTHDHALDYSLTHAALGARGGGWVGLIGSRTKRARFTRRLLADGLDPAALERLTCPIGVEGITGKAPEIIAVSVAADLLRRQEASLAAIAAPECVLASL